jgi:hypothetical protein
MASDRRGVEHECVLRRVLLTVLVALVAAAPATAGTIVVSLTFVPGKLVVKAPPTALSPAGTVQVPVTVADGRGNGKGWTLRSSVPVSVVSITARCAATSTCTLPAAAGSPAGRTVLRAAPGTGMGVMQLVVTLAAADAAAVTFGIR